MDPASQISCSFSKKIIQLNTVRAYKNFQLQQNKIFCALVIQEVIEFLYSITFWLTFQLSCFLAALFHGFFLRRTPPLILYWMTNNDYRGTDYSMPFYLNDFHLPKPLLKCRRSSVNIRQGLKGSSIMWAASRVVEGIRRWGVRIHAHTQQNINRHTHTNTHKGAVTHTQTKELANKKFKILLESNLYSMFVTVHLIPALFSGLLWTY